MATSPTGNLAHRTREDIEATGIRLRLEVRARRTRDLIGEASAGGVVADSVHRVRGGPEILDVPVAISALAVDYNPRG